ncbi:MAG: BlaI/MecI/CopY family transcriptional regulator [Verrucomicrobiales bacterium]|jgi:predicted transcriptional regulator|nr:BlaI/MecI/CopY family transcriptional regulator [Verrucomicrobiales bacterium]
MGKTLKLHALSRRERELMDIVYAGGAATAQEIMDAMERPPTYSSVRSALRLLELKGHLRHRRAGLKYVFAPVAPRERTAKSALRQLAATFFDNSAGALLAALLDLHDTKLSRAELGELERMIREAKEGKQK